MLHIHPIIWQSSVPLYLPILLDATFFTYVSSVHHLDSLCQGSANTKTRAEDRKDHGRTEDSPSKPLRNVVSLDVVVPSSAVVQNSSHSQSLMLHPFSSSARIDHGPSPSHLGVMYLRTAQIPDFQLCWMSSVLWFQRAASRDNRSNNWRACRSSIPNGDTIGHPLLLWPLNRDIHHYRSHDYHHTFPHRLFLGTLLLIRLSGPLICDS